MDARKDLGKKKEGEDQQAYFLTYSRNFLPQCSYILTCSFGPTSHSLTGVATFAPQLGHLAMFSFPLVCVFRRVFA